tara:strand:+ start:1075 stop:1542 length:468 start_codon:yes stop_codon:yes gene_type:complete
MFDNLKQNIPSFQLFITYLLYIILLVYSTFPVAILWLIFNIYVWLVLSTSCNTYNINAFVFVLSAAGVVVSISLFFLQGVEQLPFPEGALMFNIENIMKAALLFFLSTIPLIMIGFGKKQDNYKTTLSEEKPKENQDLWEEATPEDLESGNYEVL